MLREGRVEEVFNTYITVTSKLSRYEYTRINRRTWTIVAEPNRSSVVIKYMRTSVCCNIKNQLDLTTSKTWAMAGGYNNFKRDTATIWTWINKLSTLKHTRSLDRLYFTVLIRIMTIREPRDVRWRRCSWYHGMLGSTCGNSTRK